MDEPINWQSIGEKMLAYKEKQAAEQQAIAQLEEMSKRQTPIDPSELVEIVSILKGNEVSGDEAT